MFRIQSCYRHLKQFRTSTKIFPVKPNPNKLLSGHFFKEKYKKKNIIEEIDFKFSCGIFSLAGIGALFFSDIIYADEKDSNKNISCTEEQQKEEIPEIEAQLTFAPNVPPPINRSQPAIVKAKIEVLIQEKNIDDYFKYSWWTFNGNVPGPFIRVREGDTLEVTLENKDMSGMQHNIDFHAVTGPGGGAPLITVESGEKKTSLFKMLHPGLFFYHCSVGPTAVHVSNGMYGMILVEPKHGLPKADKEFYILQSEIYTDEPAKGSNLLELSYQKGMEENPSYVVFNGRVKSMQNEGTLQVNAGERIRIFFGNAGPSLISSFHIIGMIFDKVYREGDLISPPARSLQTTLVATGGATVVEFDAIVPGIYTIIDHSLFRIEKGAAGFLNVNGKPRPDIYYADHEPAPCSDCELHP